MAGRLAAIVVICGSDAKVISCRTIVAKFGPLITIAQRDETGRRFLDPVSGRYYATPAPLAPGIFVRPLALGDAPSAEALALLAGVPPEQAGIIAAGLLALDPPGSGDGLLALALLP